MGPAEVRGGVHVVVATALIPPSVVEQMAALVPDGVTVSSMPVPWNDRFPTVRIADEWAGPLARAHVLVGYPQQIEGLLEAAPELRWVQYVGAGYERAPLEELRGAGIGLVSGAGAGADGVAEFAVMAMLSLARRAPERFAAQQRREWARFVTSELSGRRCTVVGAGEIGTRLCRICAALGLEVTCVRRRPEAGCPPGAGAVFGAEDLDSVLRRADRRHQTAQHRGLRRPPTGSPRGECGERGTDRPRRTPDRARDGEHCRRVAGRVRRRTASGRPSTLGHPQPDHLGA